jgi:hypothetical protein
MKNSSFAEGGYMYNVLHRPVDRLMASFCLTLVMLVVATVLSFFVPTAVYLAVLFGPGAFLFAFGGLPTRRHWSYGLTTNQKLAIERYYSADDETRKLFPADFVETVRNAKAGSGGTKNNDQYLLAAAAEKILTTAQKRKETLNIRDDKVEVALEFIRQNVEALELDTTARQEVASVGEMPKTAKKMIGRKVVEVPNPLYGRVQDR